MSERELGAALLESAWVTARIAAGLAVAFAVAAAVVAHARARRAGETGRAPVPGALARVLLHLVSLLAVAVTTAFTAGQAGSLPPAAQAVLAATAALCALTGAMLVAWASATLGAEFGALAGARRDAAARLVVTGPYALVRHPIYSALLLLAFGTALAFGSLAGALAVVVLVVPAMRARAGLEDRELARAFPGAHEHYAARTPGFVPRGGSGST